MVQRKIDLLQVLNNLNYIKVTGPNLGAGVPSESIESLAEHSYKVCYLCLIFSNIGKNISLENLLKYAIVHDWGECLLGDMPLSGRSYLSYFDQGIKDMHKKAEGRAKGALLRDAGVNFPTLNKEEMKLFKFCDVLSRVIELIDLRQRGFRHSWIGKMCHVHINLLKKFNYPFTTELIIELSQLFERGYMDNKYLTKATK